MTGLKNKDLECLSKKILKKKFLGVFSSDIHPRSVKKKTFFLIFNLSKHFQKGSHFIAIAKMNKKVIYFDPLGNKCSNMGILKFLLKIKSKIIFTKKQIQSDHSIFCGFFCLAFLLYISKNKSLKSFLKIFSSSNLPDNDKICIDIILNEINT
jgi:hypothetical protein